jgi:hypothetical protein
MKTNYITVGYSLFFLIIFFIKMSITTAPIFFSLDKKVINAVIMQLELENNSKENPAEAKDNANFFKKGIDFIHCKNFEIAQLLILDDIDYHFIYKQYIKTFFPRVPTPPPNLTYLSHNRQFYLV